jgi:phage-related protein
MIMAGSAGAIRAGRAFVELFADNSKLVKGLRAAERQVKDFGNKIRNIGAAIAGIGMAVTAPLAGMVTLFTSSGDQLSKMAQRTGVAVESLSQLRYAASQCGTDIETLEKSLQLMSKNLAAMSQSGKYDDLLQLGVDPKAIKNANVENRFLILGEAISRIEDPTMRAAAAMKIFGKSGTALLPLFADGAKGVMILCDRAKALGLEVSALDAANAVKLKDAFDDIWQTVKSVGFKIGASFAEPLLKLTDAIINVVVATGKWVDQNRALIVTIGQWAAIAVAVGAGIAAFGTGLIGVAKIIGVVASVVKVALGGLNILSSVFRSLAVVVGAVVSVFSGVATAVGSVFSVVASTIGVILGTITAIIGTAFSVLAGLGTAVFGAIGAAIAAILSPIGLTIIALGAVAGACYLVYRNASAIGNIFAAAFSAVVGGINNAITAIYRFLAGFTEFKILFGTINIVSAAVKTLGGTLFWIANSLIKPTFLTIFGVFLQFGKIVANTATTIGSVLIACFRQILGAAGAVFAAVASIVATSFIKAVSVIGGVVSGIGSLIGHALAPAFGVIGAVFRGAVSMILTLGGVLQTASGWVIAFARSFFVVESAVQVFSLIGSAVSGMIGIFSRIAGTITSTLFSVVQSIPAVVSGIFSSLAPVPGFVIGIFQAVPTVVSAAFSTAVGIVRGVVGGITSVFSGLVSFMSGMWNGLTATFSVVFTTLGGIVSGFGNFFIGAFANIGTAVGWLREQFGNLCSFAVETFGAITAALGRGDIESAVQVIWASIKLIWLKGSTALLSTWYWVVETLQTAWASCVYKISELLTAAWYGVQSIWIDSVYTMQVAWIGLMNGMTKAWDYVSTTIAQGIGWIMAKIMGLDPNQMAATITEDYNNRNKNRQESGRSAIDSLAKERNEKIAGIEKDKQGTLDTLKQDFDNAAGVRNAAYEAKLAAQEQELTAAKSAYDEAINRARNPDLSQGGEQQSLLSSLRTKVQEVMQGFQANPDLQSKVSVTGSFSAAAIQGMGLGSSMDRVAKATERSEKHLEKIAAKDEKPGNEVVVKKEPATKETENRDDPTVRELKLQTRYLRDLADKGTGAAFT